MDMDMDTNDHGDQSDDTNGDGEGVWSPDIEQCFREALLLFPPCGRRKHILQEEGGGKMYGRNELIARHIMMRTGKSRTRKQVSSHIQVLARRRAKAEASSSSSGAGVSPAPPASGVISVAPRSHASQPMMRFDSNDTTGQHQQARNQQQPGQQQTGFYDAWDDRPIVTSKIRLAHFSAFIEYRSFQAGVETHGLSGGPGAPTSGAVTPISPTIVPQAGGQPASLHGGFNRHSYIRIDYPKARCQNANKLERIEISQIQDKFPEIGGSEGLFQRGPSDAFYLVKFWADMSNVDEYNIEDQNSYFGFSCQFETVEFYKSITCSTKVCSYGSQVVEKVEKVYGAYNNSNGRYSYNINSSPMCEFMIQFIRKLRRLPRTGQMNSVLENFTVLQVIRSESTSEILLCLAYVFEVAAADENDATQHHVYKLT